MSKVIDITSRLRTLEPSNQAVAKLSQNVFQTTESENVLSYSEQKNRLLFHERRQVKRTILSEIVSAMVVIPEKGLLKVELYDISDEGISFDMDQVSGHFAIDEVVSLRVYLNQKTYFPLSLQVKHVTPEPVEGVNRHGTVFMRSLASGAEAENSNTSDASLQYFIRFIETASSGLKQDNGDLMAPKIS